MPFQSEKQRRYLWANEPEIARDWTDTYGSRIQKNDGGIMHHFQNYAQNDGNNVSVPRSFQARPQSEQVNLAYITPQEQQMLQALKPGTPHRGPMEIPNYDSFDAAGGYSNPDTGYSASSGGGGGGWQDSGRADAKKNEMAEQVRRNYVNKENIKSSPLHNRGLSFTGSGVGPKIGNWASQFAGSKLGGGLGGMLFGPLGMLLGSMFGRNVGRRGYQAYQTPEKESVRDILLGQNTLLSNLFNKRKTPTTIGGEGIQTIDIRDKFNRIKPKPINKYDWDTVVGQENPYQDFVKQAGLTDKQKELLDQRKPMLGALGDQGILDTITSEDDPNDPATLEDVRKYYGIDI
tara:strand:- start:51 stop:1091 length:1041 start_codon:yes stop_codon:yes gene_type:complete